MIHFKHIVILIVVVAVPACEAGVETTVPAKSAAKQKTVIERTLQEQLVYEVGDRIFFEEGVGELPPEQNESGLYARKTLKKLAGWMAKHKNVQLILEGHAEDPGTRRNNLMLGAARAISALDFLVALGIDCKRFKAFSYGYERRALLGSSTGVAVQNRRVVFVVSEVGPWWSRPCP